ncbi:MAG: hypothetical protein M3O86_03755, partial [Actinomycetota bacterium]|nr:hypothetical protein [Actinomycetota bacterium]
MRCTVAVAGERPGHESGALNVAGRWRGSVASVPAVDDPVARPPLVAGLRLLRLVGSGGEG